MMFQQVARYGVRPTVLRAVGCQAPQQVPVQQRRTMLQWIPIVKRWVDKPNNTLQDIIEYQAKDKHIPTWLKYERDHYVMGAYYVGLSTAGVIAISGLYNLMVTGHKIPDHEDD